MKRFIKYIYKLFGIHTIITELQEEESINKCINSSTGGKFYSEAKVYNFQHDSKKINIGVNTHIRGELLIFAYGGIITIGDNCFIGENSKIWSGESISIGDEVLISHNVTITDGNSHELNSIERAKGFKYLTSNNHPKNKGSVITTPVIIKNKAWISFNCIILKGVTIGEGAIVAAGSVITKDVPDYTLVAGNPAKVIRQTT